MVGVMSKTCGLRRLGILVGLAGLAVVILAGCGGGSDNSPTAAKATTASTPPTASAPTSGIASLMLANNELPGFTAGAPTTDHTVRAWVTDSQTPSSQVAAETKRLTRDGFVAGASENLTGPTGPGLSIAEEFKTGAGARAELADEQKGNKADFAAFRRFAVPAIPGAIGFGGSGNGSAGINVAFAAGDRYYLVGEIVGADASSITPRAEHTLIAAAQHLYHRGQT
jgi:hypothetical protein